MPERPHQKRSKGISKGALVTGLVISLSLLLLTVVSLSGFICLKRKKEDRKKLGTILEDYKAHKPARFSYAAIKKMTSQFREKLGQGSYGTTYKGKLMNESIVAVKVLDIYGDNSEEFVGQLVKMGGIQHANVVRLVGYCADGNRRALVYYELLPNGSLENFILSRKQNKPLGWEELQKISIGVAQGIDYLHRGCNQQVLHLDIKPHNVLLDHSYNPRLTDYGIPKLCSKEQIVLTMGAEQVAMEYTAPEVLSSNFGNATSKSDVYSVGILLLEMVRRREIPDNVAEPSSQVYLPEWMYNQIDRREEIAFEIDGEEHSMIERKLMVVGALVYSVASIASAFHESSDSDARRRGHACCSSTSICSNRIKAASCNLVSEST